MDAIRADDLVQQVLCNGNEYLGKHLNADVVAISSPLAFGLDGLVKSEIENLRDQGSRTSKLVVVLETPGGYIEVVERIAGVFRKYYKQVEFIIPNYAYSAGTVLALSGDEIHMNYYSILGPIDPQFSTQSGRSVPGMGYLAKYNKLVATINAVPDDKISTVRAEMSLLLKNFDQAQLFQIEQSIEHSKELVEKWLPKYKFKAWKMTASGKKVTPTMRTSRARQIAEILGNAEHWHSHGRGISMAELMSDKIGLKVNDFGKDKELNFHVTQYHGLFTDFMNSSSTKAAVHTRHRLRRVA